MAEPNDFRKRWTKMAKRHRVVRDKRGRIVEESWTFKGGDAIIEMPFKNPVRPVPPGTRLLPLFC